MPDGHTVTLPRERRVATTYVRANLATTLRAAFIVTVHGAVPVHAPLHPVNREPVKGNARRTTTVPDGYAC